MRFVAISVVSAGVLAYEVLLTRLFSIIQWHHFAYMVISIALLGYGASGTFLALTLDRLRRHFITAFAVNAALFGLSAVAVFALAQRLPFNALEVIWAPEQLVYLVALYGLFMVPFFCGANCIGLAFACLPDRIGRVYRYDMVGAGVGALAVVALLFMVRPETALVVIGVIGLLAASIASLGERRARRLWLLSGLGAAAVALVVAIPASWTELRLSQYKGLSQALLVPGTEILRERSSPLGLLTVIESPVIPLRHAPGLSFNNTVEPPRQLGVFTDGDSLSAITAFDQRHEPLAYLDYTSAALPYHLIERPKVLILGAGGGSDVLLALYHDAAHIDAVELNPQFVELVRNDFADFAGHLYDRPRLKMHVAEARGFVARSRDRYDVIQLPLLDSFAASAAGTLSLSESYVYTVEAFEAYLRHLRPGGYLAITRWLKLPPRDSLKLFATALEALARAGVAEPAKSLAMIRSWNATTLLVKRGALDGDDSARIRRFVEARSFDLAYDPDMTPAEANRFNILDRAYFHDGAVALSGPDPASFIDRYKFDIAPATDDRPYFFDFFRWRVLPELLRIRAQGGAAMLDWGYVILAATLAQAAALSLVLILAPLWLRRTGAAPPSDKLRVAIFFVTIGLAFLFIEIASIQRFVLFLSHPLYAIAVVLSAFLIFAGLGSGLAPKLQRRLDAWRASDPRPRSAGVWSRRLRGTLVRFSALDLAVAAIVVTSMLYLALLPPLFRWLMPLPDPVKIILSLALIAPLAFWMGMPFPLVLSRVAARAPGLVPWAWGINGCASVISAILATLLAMSFGFSVVVGLATGLYVIAAAAMRETTETR